MIPAMPVQPVISGLEVAYACRRRPLFMSRSMDYIARKPLAVRADYGRNLNVKYKKGYKEPLRVRK
jgi:hypothetical protein